MNLNPYNRVEMAEGTWAVLCLGKPMRDEDIPPDFDPYTDSGREPALATRSGFATREEAAHYAASINPSWLPMVARLEVP